MQSLNIVLTKSYIYYKSPDLSLDETILEINPSDSDTIEHFSELLNELELPRDTSLNLVLDRSFISYFYFNLPPISRRKLDKILQYELADVLIDELDQYFYDYQFSNLAEEETQIGIFLIKKDLVNKLIQIGKTCHLEIRSILSLDNLLDMKMQEHYAPGNEILVTGDRYDTNLIVYKHGFATGFSDQRTTNSEEATDSLLKDLNWRIKAIELNDNEINSIRLSDESKTFLDIDENSELITKSEDKNGVPTSHCSTLFNGSQYARTKQINLLKSNFFIFQEIKKHLKKIILLSSLLAVGGVFFIVSAVYQGMQNKERYSQLESVYKDSVKKYLPENPNADNAPEILRKMVGELKAQRQENEKFVKREYKISSQLDDISALKRQVNSLTLARFFLTEQAIRIQGEVSTFTEYDKMKNSLQSLYAEDFQLRFNQKSSGEDKISFTVTIRPNK
ncbi:MAG: hypothetical protein MJE63_16985 [Proteobacteria bacterium]|nr:hypothetical protein [Pseudomonadota bacterium]